jgi:hypothetical protein
VKKHCIRNGLFISFFEHHAVSLPNGKIAIMVYGYIYAQCYIYTLESNSYSK